jgi:hypothetical protein
MATDKCKYKRAWTSPCGKPSVGDFCAHHLATRCVVCGSHAVRECAYATGLVCGEPLCDGCEEWNDDYIHRHRRRAVTLSPIPASPEPAPVLNAGSPGGSQTAVRGLPGISWDSRVIPPVDGEGWRT